ncbi:immunoglobulin lambda-1 light chain-like [Mustelus asterias]
MFVWLRVLAVLALCLQCTNAAPVLTQPASISTSLGKTVTITCTMSGASMSSYYTSWYWQKPGSAPAFVWRDYDSTRGSGIPERLTGSRDLSKNVMYLTNNNVKAEDVADYYCGSWDFSAGRFTFGKGTKLNLGAPRAPSVSVLPPSSDQVKENDKATLVCFINSFNPGVVEVEWFVDGSVRGNGVETSRVLQETNSTFSVSSYLTLSTSEWNSHELYSCVVKHQTLANPLTTNIQRSRCI